MKNEFNPKEIEEKIKKFWQKNNFFEYKKDKRKIYSIDTPPATISGEIHMGHVYGYIPHDIIARFKRMNNFNVFYGFGFDDNGIATERFVEQEAKVKANDMKREEFNKLCLEVTKKMEDKMRKLWQDLGVEPNWKSLYRTIDPEVIKSSQLSFIKLYEQGREYRRKGPNFFCPECSTAVSQVELEDKPRDAYFNDIIFKLEDGEEFVISTTRPELIPACVAIFIHPEDKKNSKILGKKAIVPLFNHKIPILKDERVDMKKGTGIVMCCTFGDQTDIDWYFAHELPLRVAIDEKGRMTKLAGKYEGLKVKEAREKIIEDLKKRKHLFGRKKIKHDVKIHERCGTDIEFLISEQWFIKVLDLKEKWLELGRKMRWHPEHMNVRYNNWVNGLQWDWCISRQRFFGVPFPVWYCKKCQNVILAEKSQLPVNPLTDKPNRKCRCGSGEFVPEEDIMDTWATSSLTPLINSDWDGENTNEVYPMVLRPQGHEIISFWLFHTIVKCYLHTGELPFKDIIINGWVLDEKGKKMSKSKGNIISPLEILDKFPADAIRFWSCGSKTGEDVPFKEIDIINGERFMRKIWNSFNLAENCLKNVKKPKNLGLMNLWILSKVDHAIENLTKNFDNYDFYKVKNEIRRVFWHSFCDNYLEIVKKRIYEEDEEIFYTLYHSLSNLLKLLSPVMPFMAEEIYQKYLKNIEKTESIHLSEWPKKLGFLNRKVERQGDLIVEIISLLRKYKSENNLSLKTHLELVKINLHEKISNIDEFKKIVKDTMNVKKIEFIDEEIKENISEIKLDYSKAGPKFGKDVKEIEDMLKKGKYNYNDDKISLKINGKEIILKDEIKIKKKVSVKGFEILQGENVSVLVKEWFSL